VAAVIRSAHPDVVGLQEVDNSWSRSGSVDQAAVLGRLLGMHHYFDPDLDCVDDDLDGDGFCQYGTAILSRYPFVAGSARHYALPNARSAEPRGLARIAIDVRGRMVDLFNTHVTFVPGLRARQVAVIKNVVRQDRRPFVLTGDFNALPFYLEMVSLRRVARDAAIAGGRPHLRTTALSHPVRLDYIMLPRPPIDGPAKRVEVQDVYVIARPRVSDHRPLVARIRIPATL
jgi:endonuclease/exonuclease/phosphatase family metal-dependent hydrolase